jgi:hypothetical protein
MYASKQVIKYDCQVCCVLLFSDYIVSQVYFLNLIIDDWKPLWSCKYRVQQRNLTIFGSTR